jgi:hypothetical protein
MYLHVEQDLAFLCVFIFFVFNHYRGIVVIFTSYCYTIRRGEGRLFYNFLHSDRMHRISYTDSGES